MRLAIYWDGGKARPGVVEGDFISPLADAGDCLAPLIASGEIPEPWRQARRPLSDVQILAPIRSTRFFCIGLNYQSHVAETQHDANERPSVFTRTAASLAAHGQPLWRPEASESFDFEGELACIIGKPGRHISRDDALNHVFGFTCFNDGSVRAYQKHSVTAGKNFERSGAIGPWIVTADEAPAWDRMHLATRLNGLDVQSVRTDQMLFGVPELIAYLSQVTTLHPGDVIATGTPSGVGARRTPPLWMKPGDRIEVTISGIGTLANPVVQEGETGS